MESSYIGASPAYGIFQRQVAAGDGSTTVFNLDYTVTTPTQLLVSIDGIIQEPEYSYAVSFANGSSTINFSEPPDAGIELLNTTGDGNTAAYTLPRTIYETDVLYVTLNNVATDQYTVSGTTITFNSNVTAGVTISVTLRSRIWIVYMGRQLLVPTQALSSPHIDSFTGDGSTGTFTLTRVPSVAGAANMLVFVDGTYQTYGLANDYTVSGDSLIFNAGSIPTNSSKITAIQLAESNNVIDTVLDGSITNAKLSLTYSSATFTGNGVWTDRTIDAGHSVESILVFYNGVCLQPTTDYTVSGTTLTFTFTPLNNSNIVVRYLPI